jgi:hypothetical protein
MGFQNVKKNKVECIQLLEDTHGVLYAIIDVHLTSDIPGNVSLPMLHHVAEFTVYTSPCFDLGHYANTDQSEQSTRFICILKHNRRASGLETSSVRVR